jgi:hypothetical protein
MLRMKFFAMALVLGLAGAVYAAGRIQDATQHQHPADAAGKAPACCQAKHGKAERKEGQTAEAMSCDKDGAGCCEGHHADAKQTAARPDGESCCDGGSCCKEGADCCKAHKAHGAQAASADVKKEGGCACCATSCPTHAGR